MKGYHGFESWDETYVHHKHNPKDRVVLEYRVEGKVKEPWTWVRTQGKGRVFYTAWGHDQRTWGHPGFQNLVERGVRWAVGGNPGVVRPYSDHVAMTTLAKDVPPFRYIDAKVPFYAPGGRGSSSKALSEDAIAADSRRVDEAHGPSGRLRAETVRHGEGTGRQADLHELGRARPTVGRRHHRLSQRVAAAGRGPRPHRHSRRHQGHGPGRQGHRLRRQTEHSHQPHLLQGRSRRPPGAGHAVSETTKGDDKADVRKMLFTGWDTATRTPGRATCATAWTTGSTASSATPASTAPSAARGSRSARASTASSRTARSWSSSAARTTTPGASASARRDSSSARRPTATPASTCRSRTATTSRCAAGRPRSSAASPARRACSPDHRQDPSGGPSRRLHRGRGPRPVHRPHLSARLLEPHRLRRRADRPSGRYFYVAARRAATSPAATP